MESKIKAYVKLHGKTLKWEHVAKHIKVDGNELRHYLRTGKVSDPLHVLAIEEFMNEYPRKPHFVECTDADVFDFLSTTFVSIFTVSKSLGIGNALSQFMCGSRKLPAKRRYEIIRELSRWGLK